MNYTKEEMLEQNRQSSIQTLKALIGKLEYSSTLPYKDLKLIKTGIDSCIDNIT